MNLEKILYTIGVISLTLFMVSAILILTNKLNMWLVGIISLIICTTSFVTIKIMKNKSNK